MPGTPVESLAFTRMPTIKAMDNATVTAATKTVHLEIMFTHIKKHLRVTLLSLRKSQLQQQPHGDLAPCLRERDSLERAEISMTCGLDDLLFFRFLRSLSSCKTRAGGRRSSSKMNDAMTQRPMKAPNSRRGCSTLAKFAKKLTEVVSEVARQALPACAIT
mmetsp:Transcript_14924/g.28859  ORF Transcript_14924/g.28859 Transcript_14924/m.28859 type:complete len:161 (-) Transcript_14924:692-1174(-)